jgi:hypothetical protein
MNGKAVLVIVGFSLRRQCFRLSFENRPGIREIDMLDRAYRVERLALAQFK